MKYSFLLLIAASLISTSVLADEISFLDKIRIREAAQAKLPYTSYRLRGGQDEFDSHRSYIKFFSHSLSSKITEESPSPLDQKNFVADGRTKVFEGKGIKTVEKLEPITSPESSDDTCSETRLLVDAWSTSAQ